MCEPLMGAGLLLGAGFQSFREARETFDYLLTHGEMRRNAFEMALAYWSGVLVMRLVAGARKRIL